MWQDMEWTCASSCDDACMEDHSLCHSLKPSNSFCLREQTLPTRIHVKGEIHSGTQFRTTTQYRFAYTSPISSTPTQTQGCFLSTLNRISRMTTSTMPCNV